MSNPHNILVISDLHLGEDLNPAASVTATRDLAVAERQLVEFLRHYTRKRRDGLPWRLVINGDMVDFMMVRVLESERRIPGPDGDAQGREERELGLGRREAVALERMRTVVNRHTGFFAALARFLARGNRVEIIAGNHDIEFHWESIQREFAQAVAIAWERVAGPRLEQVGGEVVARRIGFHPWFYYEPGVAWIEHGHQYDECCSFEFGLCPVDPRRNEIVTNVDYAGLHYIAGYVEEMDAHGAEAWSFGGYMRFAFSIGRKGSARLAKAYYRFSRGLLRAWRSHKSFATQRSQRTLQAQRVAALSADWSVPVSTLDAVDELRRRPVIGHFRRLLQVLMLDKIAIGLGAVLLGLVALAALPLWLTVAVAGAIVVACHAVFDHMDKGRNVDPTVPLAMMPLRILRHVDARFVVFGHSHIPVAQPLEGDKMYFNTGTWLPSGGSGLLRSFTHLVISHHAAGAKAVLCQWRDGASRPFTAGWAPDYVAAAQLEGRARDAIRVPAR